LLRAGKRADQSLFPEPRVLSKGDSRFDSRTDLVRGILLSKSNKTSRSTGVSRVLLHAYS